MRATTVAAPDLRVGDVILSAGISGVIGRVTSVQVVVPEKLGARGYVGVRIEGGHVHSLGVLEACDIERELRAEAR